MECHSKELEMMQEVVMDTIGITLTISAMQVNTKKIS